MGKLLDCKNEVQQQCCHHFTLRLLTLGEYVGGDCRQWVTGSLVVQPRLWIAAELPLASALLLALGFKLCLCPA